MENTLTPATAQTTDPQLTAKLSEWSKLITKAHTTELQLQAKCSELVNELAALPTTAEDLHAAETVLKYVKASVVEEKEKRIAITSIFERVKTRMMQPENSVLAAIPAYEAAIISIKKTEKERLAKEQGRIDETARFRESFATHITNSHAAADTLIATKVIKCFEHCLTTNVQPGELLMDKMKAAITPEMIATTRPAYSAGVYLDITEVGAIWNEVIVKMAIPPADTIARYHAALEKQFEFYSVAFKNKEASLALAKQTAAEETARIETERGNAAVANKLEGMAETATVSTSTGKKLKSVYKLDMPDDWNSVVIIMTAFAANYATAKEKTRVKSPMALGLHQMGAALEALRTEDDRFSVSGLVWKTVDKL